MILSRTPLRLSLFGGGTDVPEFYMRAPGAVVSFTINRYIHVGVNAKFDGRTRVSYSRTEDVDDPWKLGHDLVRETLYHFDLRGLEITSVSDIPGEGSGLGSSSAFTVGLVHALHAHQDGNDRSPAIFAESAYAIEHNLCGHPVGKQDHYAAAFGGLNFFQFNTDGSVTAESIPLAYEVRKFLEHHVMLFWTGRTRKANTILAEQARRFGQNETIESGQMLANYARMAHQHIKNEDFKMLGSLLDENWYWKQKLATVSTDEIDLIYHKAKLAGAQGGKLCGAGGGGFLVLIADPADGKAIEEAIGLRRVYFQVEEQGSRVVYKG